MSKEPATFFTPDEADPLLAAVSIALALMKVAKVDRWEQMAQIEPGLVAISSEQQHLLAAAGNVLGYLRRNPTVTVAKCPRCGLISFVASSVPAKCTLTRGCTGGRAVKATEASRRPVPKAPRKTRTTAPKAPAVQPQTLDEAVQG
ncbi:hypothetical protein ACFWGN_14990 [Oerskovia sp. NPDC060338]|uniref:hypothetical protein n=1 Tax=Oerskovia sp. NPDC060338 TaxID=3347100 RepID=UPI0036473995